jgi:hypothetical protein
MLISGDETLCRKSSSLWTRYPSVIDEFVSTGRRTGWPRKDDWPLIGDRHDISYPLQVWMLRGFLLLARFTLLLQIFFFPVPRERVSIGHRK